MRRRNIDRILSTRHLLNLVHHCLLLTGQRTNRQLIIPFFLYLSHSVVLFLFLSFLFLIFGWFSIYDFYHATIYSAHHFFHPYRWAAVWYVSCFLYLLAFSLFSRIMKINFRFTVRRLFTCFVSFAFIQIAYLIHILRLKF